MKKILPPKRNVSEYFFALKSFTATKKAKLNPTRKDKNNLIATVFFLPPIVSLKIKKRESNYLPDSLCIICSHNKANNDCGQCDSIPIVPTVIP